MRSRRTHRDPEGRRLVDLRLRRHRRRGQHHPAPRLHRATRSAARAAPPRNGTASAPTSPSPRASAISTPTATTSCSASNTRNSTRSGTATARPRLHRPHRPARSWGYSAATQALGRHRRNRARTAAPPAAPSTATCATPDTPITTTAATCWGQALPRTFPGAACSNFTNHPQGDPGGGCIIDGTLEYNQIEPKQENFSFLRPRHLAVQPRDPAVQRPRSITAARPTPRPRRPASALRSAFRAGRSTTPSSRSARTTRTTPISAPRRVCATWRPTSARASPTSAPNFIRWVVGAQGHDLRLGLGLRACCSRTTTSTTSRTATCSATSPSPC